MVISCKYVAYTNDSRNALIMDEKIGKKKQKADEKTPEDRCFQRIYRICLKI